MAQLLSALGCFCSDSAAPGCGRILPFDILGTVDFSLCKNFALSETRRVQFRPDVFNPPNTPVRAHNLLTSGDGTPALKWGSTDAYTEDAAGNPRYDWTIVDRIFDTYIERRMKPLVEIGFMPEALSVNPQPYRHQWAPDKTYNRIFTGWAYPPKDYNKWAELVYQWVRHSIERYGKQEVESWYWEVWNEPDIGVSGAAAAAGDYRRVGSRGLRRLLGALPPPERLSERDDVLELHRSHLRAQVRPGGPLPGESRRGGDVGLRVRGPALF